MPRKKLSQNQLHSGKDQPTKNWLGFSFKLIFTGMIAFGVFSVNSTFLKLSDGKEAVVNSSVTTAQPEVSAKSSEAPKPSQLNIPSLKILAPFIALGLNSDQTLEVPKNPMDVGWFVYGAKPGEVGAAVVVGHLNTVLGRAIFADLSKIKPGAEIIITRADDSVVTYRVDFVQKFSQDNFPTNEVYGALTYSGLRLITCSGVWNKKTGRYSDNLVVFASLSF